MRRYKYTKNGKVKYADVSPEREGEWLQKYAQYNPTLVFERYRVKNKDTNEFEFFDVNQENTEDGETKRNQFKQEYPEAESLWSNEKIENQDDTLLDQYREATSNPYLGQTEFQSENFQNILHEVGTEVEDKKSTVLDQVDAIHYLGTDREYATSEIDALTTDIISVDETSAVSKLYDLYGKWDFDFDEAKGGTNAIEVTSGNGQKKIFKVGIKPGEESNAIAEEMTNWLDENKSWIGDAFLEDFTSVSVSDEERSNIFDQTAIDIDKAINSTHIHSRFNPYHSSTTGYLSPGALVSIATQNDQLQESYYQSEALGEYFEGSGIDFNSLDDDDDPNNFNKAQHEAKVKAFASIEYKKILNKVKKSYGHYEGTDERYDMNNPLYKRLRAESTGGPGHADYGHTFEGMLRFYRSQKNLWYRWEGEKRYKRSEAEFLEAAKAQYIEDYGMSDEDFDEYKKNRAKLNSWLTEQVTTQEVQEIITQRVAKIRDEDPEYIKSTTRDKFLANEAEKYYNKLQAEVKQMFENVKVIDADINNIDKERKDLKTWLESDENSLEKKVEYLNSDEFMTDDKNRIKELMNEIMLLNTADYSGDEAKKREANEKKEKLLQEAKALNDKVTNSAEKIIKDLRSEYRSKLDRFNFLNSKIREFLDYRKGFIAKIGDTQLDAEQVEAYMNEMKKNNGVLSVFFANLGMSLLDIVQNTVGFVDLVLDIPETAAQALDKELGTGKLFSRIVGGLYTSMGLGIFADDMFGTGEGTSIFDNMSGDIDRWQEGIMDKFSAVVSFDDAETIGDWIEWGANMMASQAGNFLAMALIPYGFIAVGAAAASRKMDDVELQTRLAEGTDGIYGVERSYMSMVFNAMVTGAAETLSERVTFGAIKTTQRVISAATRKQLIEGFQVSIRKNMDWKTLYNGGIEMAEEGVSEVIATISENMVNMITGDEDAFIFDGVDESFVSGIVMSGVIQGLRATPQLMQPFMSKDANQKLGENRNKILKLESELEALENKNDGTNPDIMGEVETIKNEINDLIVNSNEIIDKEIIRIDSLSDPEKRKLLDIAASILKARRKARNISEDPELTETQISEQIAELQIEVDNLINQQNEILDAHPESVVNAQYDAHMEAVNQYNEEAKEMGIVEITGIREVTDAEMADVAGQDKIQLSSGQVYDLRDITKKELKALKKLIKDKKASKEIKEAAREKIKQLEKDMKGWNHVIEWFKVRGRNYGAIIPKYNDKGNITGFDILINRSRAIKDGKYATVVHEFMHRVLHKTLKGNAMLRKRMGDQVLKILGLDGDLNNVGKSRVKWKPGKLAEFKKRVSQYAKEKKGEEIVTILSEMMADGHVTFDTNILTKFWNMLSHWFRNRTTRDIKFNNTKDVENFLKDFHVSIKKGKPNKAILLMMEKGANGKIFKHPTQSEIDKSANFSEAVILNQRSNPELKNEFDNLVKDRDGERKYQSNQSFKNSPDYFEAYNKIIDSKLLDGLIQQGMTELGLPPAALKEFTRKVKENLAMRFLKNFDITKNESLFGWLAGKNPVIQFAKRDVMKEYVKEGTAKKTSIDQQIGEDGGTIGDMIQAERDILLDQIEDADLAPGRKQAAIDAVNELKAKEVLEFSPEVSSKIMKIIHNAKIPLDGLTYKSVKKLIKDGALSEVLDIVAKEFGIEAKRIRINQDLNNKQRKAAQNYIFNKSVNEDGSFNTTLLDILPEGETRSGEATGVANTKLGDLYKTGGRVKVSEGADKGLGQKKSQTKRNDITKEEFLSIFGINPDGSVQSGTKFDGAIRALVVQVTQAVANQDLRIDALTHGTTAESIIAKLGDGKSEIMFSLNSTEQNTLHDRWGELQQRIMEAQGKTILTEGQFSNIVDEVFIGLKPKQLKKIKSELVGAFKQWVEIVEAQKKIGEFKDKPLDLQVHLLESLYIDENIVNQTSINELLELKQGEVGDRFLTQNEVDAHRANIQHVFHELVDNQGYSAEDAARLIMTHLKSAVAGEGRIGKGEFIPDPNNPGKTIKNPNWENKVNEKGEIVEYGDKYRKYDARNVKNGPEGTKVGDVMRNKKGEPILKGNSYKYVETVNDFINLINSSTISIKSPDGRFIRPLERDGKVIKGKYEFWNPKKEGGPGWSEVKTSLLKQKTKDFLNDKDGPRREKESKEAQDVAKIVLDIAFEKIGTTQSESNGGSTWTRADFGAVMLNLGSSMDAPLRFAAPITAYQSNIQDVIDNRKAGESIGDVTQLEHSVPKSILQKRIWQYYTKSENRVTGELEFETWDDVFDGYQAFIISKEWDKAQNDAGYQTSMPIAEILGLNQFRAFNNLTADALAERIVNNNLDINVVVGNMTSVKAIPDLQVEDFSKRFKKLVTSLVEIKHKKLKKDRPNVKNIVEAVNKQSDMMESKGDVESNGASVFDFDETLIIDGENFVTATSPSGDIVKIKSGDWPVKGPELAKQGYEFDFSDFVNVRGGVDGPLLQKMRNQIEKYGPKNVFILTARPMEAAIAIHRWLESKGINIPIENITGLGDSTGKAKADWMLGKYAEGYNDMYFVDDALSNVEAVKEALDQLDIKSKVVQAKLKDIGKKIKDDSGDMMESKGIDEEFNDMIERITGIESRKRFSVAEGKQRGRTKGGWNFFIPPSAEDFKGLMYWFLGKGKRGDMDMAWMKEHLFDPFSKAIRNWNTYRQRMAEEYLELKSKNKNVVKNLNKKVAGTNFTLDTAIRVYLWSKAGFEVPGLAETTKRKLLDHINNNPEALAFAETLSTISRTSDGYIKPGEFWMVQTIANDLMNIVNKEGRKQFLKNWIDKKNIIFSDTNMAKIEAAYGENYVEALKNILYRMETGSNRITGKFDGPVNSFLNWINGSVGATMFWNIRSAVLQTMSIVNFMNWGDNNIFKASAAFANAPQFWSDFAFIFNSPMLKQRRAGLAIDVSASELTNVFANSNNKPQAIIAWLLEKGFTPTRIADSFAIAFGGASFYRNRINKYIKEGMSKAEAQEQAWLDFQEISEETQQSSRPDMISQEQAGVLGRIVLAWQNTPGQMTRLTFKALSDIVNGRGDMKENVSRVIYYGMVQNIIFSTLQSGLMFLLFGGEEEDEAIKDKQIRSLNSAFDSLLRGTGVYGSAISTLKNVIIQWDAQSKKDYGKQDWSKVAVDAVSLSPPVGSKLRKIMNSVKTYEYNKGVPAEIPFRIENPMFSMAGSFIEATTNVPVARVINKMNNVEEALTGNHETWQRIALLSGWNMWNVGIKDEELEQAKVKAKETRKEKKKELKLLEKEKEQREKEAKGIKVVQCSGTRTNGERCKLTTETKAKTWKCPHHSEFKDGMDRDGDGVKEYRCTAITSSGKRCGNKTENKNKKCYAHQ